jgi:hypothetical protein
VRVEIPPGTMITIDASDTEPRWITATSHDLHVAPERDHSLVPGAGLFPLYRGVPTLITGPVLVREPDGSPSSVDVVTRQPAGGRAHVKVAA